jgi:hypothetical protein
MMAVALLACFSSTLSASIRFSQRDSGVADVSLCELIAHPDDYDGRIVRVRGIYRSFFELSELYCPKCYDDSSRIWIAEGDEVGHGTTSNLFKRLEKGRTLSVEFVGRFEAAKASYGHSNAYRYQIGLISVKKAVVISKDRPLLPTELGQRDAAASCP